MAGGGAKHPSLASAVAKERVDLYLYYPPLGPRGLLEDEFYLHYYYYYYYYYYYHHHHHCHHQLHCCYTLYLSVSHILTISSEYFPKQNNLLIFVQESPSVFCGTENRTFVQNFDQFNLNISNILNAPVVLDWSF